MKLSFKVVNGDGTGIGNDIPVAPVCNALHSMLRQFDVLVNNRLVSSSRCNYAYTSYFQNQFLANSRVKHTSLETQIFYEQPREFNYQYQYQHGN